MPTPPHDADSRPRTDSPITSVDERLAYCMVDGLYTKSLDEQDAVINRTPLPLRNRKRAVNFREYVRWLQTRIVPQGLLGKAFVEQRGNSLVSSDGTNKRAVYVQLYWVMHKPRHIGQRPHLQMELLTYTARKGSAFIMPLLRVSRHALMRLYRRLGTTSHDTVRLEFNHLAVYYPHLCMLQNHAQPNSDYVWVLRSLNGVFLVCRDDAGSSLLVVKTWLSNRHLAGTALARKFQELSPECHAPLILKDLPALPMVSLEEICQRQPVPSTENIPQHVHQALLSCYRQGRTMPPAFNIVPMPGFTESFNGSTQEPAFPLALLLPGTLRLRNTH